MTLQNIAIERIKTNPALNWNEDQKALDKMRKEFDAMLPCFFPPTVFWTELLAHRFPIAYQHSMTWQEAKKEYFAIVDACCKS